MKQPASLCFCIFQPSGIGCGRRFSAGCWRPSRGSGSARCRTAGSRRVRRAGRAANEFKSAATLLAAVVEACGRHRSSMPRSIREFCRHRHPVIISAASSHPLGTNGPALLNPFLRGAEQSAATARRMAPARWPADVPGGPDRRQDTPCPDPTVPSGFFVSALLVGSRRRKTGAANSLIVSAGGGQAASAAA